MKARVGLGFLLLAGCAAATGPQEPYLVTVPAKGAPQVIALRLTQVDDFQAAVGGSDALRATVTTNVPALAPTTKVTGVLTTITQRLPMGRTLPDSAVNHWRATFGPDDPLRLDVLAGRMAGDWQLGGLRLTGLNLAVGVQGPHVRFAEANRAEMAELLIKAGTGEFRLSGLSRANTAYLKVEGGAGSMALDFAGELSRPAVGEILAGVGDVRLSVPAAVPMRLRGQKGVGALRVADSWRREGEAYLSPAYAPDRPAWALTVSVGVGDVIVLTPAQ